jgi:hypothetical protein
MPDEILTGAEIERLLRLHMPQGQWMTLPQIYGLIEGHASLTPSDVAPDGPGSKGIRWKRNVRNLLHKRKSEVGRGGVFEWDPGTRRYRVA